MMGIIAVLQSFLGLSTILTVLGLNTSILRLIPEYLVKYSPTSAFKLYRKALYIVVLISLFAATFFFVNADYIAGTIFSNPDLSFYFFLASVFVVFKSLMLLNTEAIRGLRLIRIFALMQILPIGLNLLFLSFLTVSYYSDGNPVYSMFASIGVTGILGWIIMELSFKKRVSHKDVVHHIPAIKILSISFPMLMTATMSFAIGQTGVLILGFFRSETEIGYFAIAVKLATLTSFVIAAINSMAGPKFSELYHSKKMDDLFHVARKAAKLVFWTTAPILVGFVVLGKPLLHFLYGKEFTIAYPAMILIVIGQFVNAFSGSTSMFMNMTGHQKAYRNIIIISALLNVCLNFLLIPCIGINGSAIAIMISISFLNITTLLFIVHKYKMSIGYFPLLTNG